MDKERVDAGSYLHAMKSWLLELNEPEIFGIFSFDEFLLRPFCIAPSLTAKVKSNVVEQKTYF